MNVSGGTDVSGTVGDGGTQTVFSGGTASDTLVADPGLQIVSAGASATSVIVSGGEQDVYGIAVSTTVESGVDSGGTHFSGSEIVESGGFTSFTTVSAGGSEIVSGGGTAFDAIVSSGGNLVISPGGTASGGEINGGTFEVVSGGSVSGSLTFDAGGGTLKIDGPYTSGLLLPNATLHGLAPGAVIDLTGLTLSAVNSVGVAGNELELNDGGTAYDLKIDPSSVLPNDYFHLVSAGAGTEIVEDNTPCYCRGTLIRTDRGQARVERLKIGDKVKTVSGVARPIKWIGRRSYGGRFVMGRKDILPICIKAGASRRTCRGATFGSRRGMQCISIAS